MSDTACLDPVKTCYFETPKECSSVCPESGVRHRDMASEAFANTYARCLWTGRCKSCGKRWEVDSSG